ncbi:MAG: hypothetical protein C0592_01600, partial [Marinilabiliales bacterium]
KGKDGFQYIFGDLSFVWAELFSGFSQYLILACVILMMLINWSAEAFKWQRITGSLQKLSFTESLKSVLAGLAVGFFVPNRVGEFAGKSLMLEKASFWKASVLAFYTSFAQLLTTGFWGLLALMFFSELLEGIIPFNLHYFSVAVFALIMIVLILVYFSLNRFTYIFKRLKRIYKQIDVLNQVRRSDKFYVLAFSFIRFIVFTSQYIILLALLEIKLPFSDAFLIISLMYLILMVLPTIALTELPARSALLFMLLSAWGELSNSGLPDALEVRVILASTLIWLINIAVPAIVGAFFIPGFSIFKRKAK